MARAGAGLLVVNGGGGSVLYLCLLRIHIQKRPWSWEVCVYCWVSCSGGWRWFSLVFVLHFSKCRWLWGGLVLFLGALLRWMIVVQSCACYVHLSKCRWFWGVSFCELTLLCLCAASRVPAHPSELTLLCLCVQPCTCPPC